MNFFKIGEKAYLLDFVRVYKLQDDQFPSIQTPRRRSVKFDIKMAIVGKGMTMTKNQKKKAEQPKLKPKKQKAHVIRALKNKEPKLVENTKNLLLMRGGKTNAVMNEVLSDLVRVPCYITRLKYRNDGLNVEKIENTRC